MFTVSSFIPQPYSISPITPLDQFAIRDIIGINILDNIQLSITNMTLYLIIAIVNLYLTNLIIPVYYLTSCKWSVIKETVYDTVYSILQSQLDIKKGEIFFPLMYTLFLFILISNLMGMIPYSFATTSHFILTFFFSFTIVLGSTLLGFRLHSLKFFSLFVPSGCPLILVPLLVLIEFISYLARNVSLGLRLAANILSGHMLLNILSGFTYKIITSSILFFVLGLIPVIFIIAFSGLELCIAFIQAQVFIVLSCSYIKDGLSLH